MHPSVIEARDIRRSFRSAKKEEGLKGTLKLLTRPEYTTHEAVKGVSFSIEAGAFVGLIGANGAGKTTLLKILSGLIPPSSGEARVLGYEPFTRPIPFRHKIALVMGQKAQLWWDLPAVDAFDLLRAIYEIPRPVYKERLGLLSNLLGVEKHLNTQIRRLSLGERMKMELIGAILHWPSVIFLDEPTIGLDVLAAHKLREFLREFNRREKATIILTSHNMEDIEKLCSRILILRSGELIFDGTPGKFSQGGERRLRVRLLEQPSLEDLGAVTGLPPSAMQFSDGPSDAGDGEEEGEGNGGSGEGDSKVIYFAVTPETLMPTLQKLMARFTIIDMGIEEPSLERVIQKLFAGAEGMG